MRCMILRILIKSFGVLAGALNFKDAMLAFGKLPRDLMYDSTIGFEFAGQVL